MKQYPRLTDPRDMESADMPGIATPFKRTWSLDEQKQDEIAKSIISLCVSVEDVFQALRAASKHPDPEVRLAAMYEMWAIGTHREYGDPSAHLGFFASALRDSDPRVRRSAAGNFSSAIWKKGNLPARYLRFCQESLDDPEMQSAAAPGARRGPSGGTSE